MKRGQATIFVILGIIIITLLVGAYYVRTAFVKTTAEKKTVEEASLSVEETNAKSEIEDCISDLAEDAILYTAARGGYYQLPSKTEFMNNIEIPYYLYKSEENVPTIETLQQQIALYLDNNIEKCQTNAEILDKSSTTTTLTDAELKVETEMPVRVGAESERRINYFSTTIQTDYKSVYEDATEVYSQLKVIDNFQIAGLSALALDKDYEMRNTIDEDKIVTLLLYKNLKIKETPLRFNFAILHDSTQRVNPDDVYSKNTLLGVLSLIQGLSNLQEVNSEESYAEEEAKYDSNSIANALESSPFRRVTP